MGEGADRVRWDAEEYARNSSAQLGWARELIAKLDLEGHEHVLDIGCGDGKVSAELARHVPRGKVVGVDSSEDMIQLARAAFFPAAQGSLSFMLRDARDLGFEEEFDVVFSNATLHWVKDHRAVLRSVARGLKPRGRILLQFGGRGNGDEIFEVARLMIESPRWREFFRDFEFPWSFYGPENYDAWCTAAGLSLCRAELLPRDMIQRGTEGLSGWIRTTWMPYTLRLPVERREEFIREAANCYALLHPANAQGDLTVEMVRLEIEAEKAQSAPPNSAVYRGRGGYP
ncbi:MAG TPA: methyltransferase domain-containing protein [Spirochaetia bacterium]|nr:methyltransferase domain-containing protein [Spirochaetia bacterium]